VGRRGRGLPPERRNGVNFDGERGGETFDSELDMERLNRQMRTVATVLLDGEWWTLAALAGVTGFPEASISARLRDFRKEQFGKHVVERRRRSQGQWEYRLIVVPTERSNMVPA
jgi:hypothetical protein